MENATKAMIIAAGMMITGILVMLILFVMKNYSNYENVKSNLKDVENIAKFNEQLLNYYRDSLYGNEIISLENMVIDYNERYSQVGNNDENYTEIEVIVDISNIKDKLTFNPPTMYLFKSPYVSGDKIKQNNTKSQFKDIIKEAKEFETGLEQEKSILLAKNIRKLVPKKVEEDIKNEKGKTTYTAKELDTLVNGRILETFNGITGENYTNPSQVYSVIGNDGEKLYKYYEYYQFKKSEFKCTKVEYNKASRRVEKMVFEATGKMK